MRYALTALPVLVLGAAFAAGCSSSSSSTSNNTDGGITTNNDVDSGSSTPTAATLPFKASNLKLDGIDASKLGDVVITNASCTISTDTKEIGCINNDLVQFVLLDQPNGAGQIGVYVAKSIRIEPNAGLKAKGTHALAIVALDSIDVQGIIDVGAETSYPTAGGFVVPTKEESPGGGPGGGGAGSTTTAGAGGGYCGTGGKGAGFGGAVASIGGKTYGSATLVPLVGGSAGGNGALDTGGSGGGAVQLVAGKTFTLGASGVISAGGGGGGFYGAAESQHGSGGGSGGAVLIEAPAASILGTIAAEGGAGGSKDVGKDGQLDGNQALSVMGENGSLGGHGSGKEDVNGGDGTWLTGDRATGGGGGAGRIRVNTTSGNSALSAKILSPSENGACATEGTVAPLQ